MHYSTGRERRTTTEVDTGKEVRRTNKNEVFAHYGKEYAECNGLGYGLWPKEDALENLKHVPELVPYLDGKRKIRITFDYDPDFPVALFTSEGTKEMRSATEFYTGTPGRDDT